MDLPVPMDNFSCIIFWPVPVVVRFLVSDLQELLDLPEDIQSYETFVSVEIRVFGLRAEYSRYSTSDQTANKCMATVAVHMAFP